MKTNKLILTFLFATLCLPTLAQKDSVSLLQFEKINSNDELVIDYKNFGCRVKSGDRLVIYSVDKGIKILRFENFHEKLLLDGIKLSDHEKQKFKMEQGDYKTQTITIEKFHVILNELGKIINSENKKDSLLIAGDSSELTLQLNKIKLTRQFRGWIELKSL